ncbi:Flp pilus assembly protein TadG [Thioclava sp. ES.031]|uniref:TadE/TadG family type IV pilus assembly protein n=1 Tax=Thioclava sp. ES.031 TaxID=1798203 RepID=UPI000BF7F9CA|nr:pilus assembly protein TadG-related protein [Thioclava sp. ES.031]PFG64383.1 Flp pilus assembly protein TadG [Thioclava sp. ES.031]
MRDKTEQNGLARRIEAARARTGRFAQEEDGAVFIFSLQVLIVLMVIGGIAIDFARQDERRTLIQSSLDRAALAAANLDQSLDPATVAKDYLSTSGLDYLNIEPQVEEGAQKEYRRVAMTATDDMPTIFGDLIGFGVKSFRSNTAAKAEESIGNVEISMVLDVSGSMGQTDSGSYYGETKIASLRDAATNFTKKMFENVQPPDAPPGRLSISIVPYNQQVSLGSDLAAAYNLSTDHTWNTCADVQLQGFNSVSLPTSGLQRTMYGWSYDFVGQGYSVYKSLSESAENCYEHSYSQVMAFEDNETDVLNKISTLRAGGDTAIDIGARWGFALLDPSAKPAATALVEKGTISSDVADRPLPYPTTGLSVDERSMKVMILMTDGQNTRTFSTRMQYRTGKSGLYSIENSAAFNDDSTTMSKMYWFSQQRDDAGQKPYYSFADRNWYAPEEIGETIATKVYETKCYTDWRGRERCYQDSHYEYQFVPRDLYAIDWSTVWSKGWSLQYVIQTFLLPPRQRLDPQESVASIYDEMAISSMFSEKDKNLHDVCKAAKDKEITVFTVAVDAPQSGKTALADCSSGPSYQYDVDSANLADAFSSIATQISTLRLTN